MITQKKTTIINTHTAPKPFGPYSQGINTGNFIFISGQLPICVITGLMPTNIYDQTTQSLQNIKNIIESTGKTLLNIVKITIFITNINDITNINSSYEKFFTTHNNHSDSIYFPARSCIEVSKLPKNAKIEIEAIAKNF